MEEPRPTSQKEDPLAATLPDKGMPRDELLAQMRATAADDAPWREGKTWSLVFYAGDELLATVKDAYSMFFSENGLSPQAFPSLKRFESEVLSITASLLNGPGAVGSMTSGGSESLLMAVKTARDHAAAVRGPIAEPEVVLPVSAHPAFHKACHYFGLKPVVIPVGYDLRADAEAARQALGEKTILMVGSAPGYPHGVVDPIEELASIAQERGVPLHVDACLGGFMLPFVERLGYPVPLFDFRVPGVTSISADIHKYGWAAKGASTILYRSPELRREQFFAYSDWPGGLYGSPTMTGTRPGGAIAAAWAALHFLGETGYLEIADRVMKTSRTLIAGIQAIEGLEIMGGPEMSVFAFRSDALDVHALAKQMFKRGWRLDRQQLPDALHMMVTLSHEPIVDDFLGDLAECTAVLVEEDSPQGRAKEGAGLYGAAGNAAPQSGRATQKAVIERILDGMNRTDG